MLQLSPTIPVVTPDGEGEAIGWLDYSKDDHLMWVVFLKATGECWIYPNPRIRAVPNSSFDRMGDRSVRSIVDSLRAPRSPAPLPISVEPVAPVVDAPVRHPGRNGGKTHAPESEHNAQRH